MIQLDIIGINPNPSQAISH